ncbi:MAG TPA: NAD-dependent epimerase/dehydratase family protein [Pseudonocardiaceae bacterium]|nr:NAD-dependent epimerase/dehydratase family protein [Pseudonocardiaceae bacterium]
MSSGFSGRRVLVTGARGFLGARLVDRLLVDGAQVHAVSRHDAPGRPDVCWWRLDLSNLAPTANMIGSVRPDVIFHLASEVTGARDVNLVLPVFRSNLQSTVNLLVASTENVPARIVLAGSLEEAGIDGGELAPSSPYAVAKWASTGYARMFSELWALSISTLRISMVYGPGQRDMSKLIPYVIDSVLQGRIPKVTSGTRRVDWVYVDDVVDALLAAARAAHSGVINIGSGSSVAIRDVVALVTRIIGTGLEAEFGALADRPLDRDWCADISAAKELIGWQPSTGLEQGMEMTVRWYRDAIDRPAR